MLGQMAEHNQFYVFKSCDAMCTEDSHAKMLNPLNMQWADHGLQVRWW